MAKRSLLSRCPSYNYSDKLWVQRQGQARKEAELSLNWKKPSLLNKILKTMFMQWKHYWVTRAYLNKKLQSPATTF